MIFVQNRVVPGSLAEDSHQEDLTNKYEMEQTCQSSIQYICWCTKYYLSLESKWLLFSLMFVIIITLKIGSVSETIAHVQLDFSMSLTINYTLILHKGTAAQSFFCSWWAFKVLLAIYIYTYSIQDEQGMLWTALLLYWLPWLY